ncbi:MAG: VWA domain-containing protein, partial [Gemmataceae bacterium]
KFQELLLLLLRTAILLLLAVALARPSFRGGGGDAVDAVLVLDTSLSMQANAGPGVTAFDRARQAALAVLAHLPSNSTVQVVACADRADVLGPRDPGRLDQARGLIEALVPTERGSDFLPAAAEAARLLARGPSPNKELYLFSDLQRGGFEARGSELKARLADLRQKATVTFVRCPPVVRGNVALAGITPQTTLRSGERADFAVLVRNAGKEAVRGLTVTLEIDGDGGRRESQALPEVGPGETRAVVVGGMIDRPGRHVLTARVRPDDIAGDDRLDRVISVLDQVGVLVVDGSPDGRDPRQSASYFLTHALNPTGSGLPLTVVPAERAAPRDLGGKELCVLVNVALTARDDRPGLSPDFLRALEPFVKDGKGLLVVAGDRVDPKAYNDELFERARLLPYPIARVERAPKEKPWTFDRSTAAFAPFVRFRQEAGYAGVDRIEVRTAVELDERPELAGESRVHLRYTSGKAALAGRRRAGEGEVLFLTTGVSDERWTDLYVAPAFVPFVQIALNALLEANAPEVNRVAGEPLFWQPPPGDAQTAFDLVSPGGARRRLRFPAAAEGPPLLTADDTRHAGLYRMAAAGREPGDAEPLFAVAPDVRDTDDRTALTAAEIDQALGFAAVHLTAGDGGFTGGERLNREWTGWLLVLLLILVLGEVVLAWYCGRAW